MQSSAANIDTQTRNRRRRTGRLSLTGLRRCLFYRPLAVFMAVMMFPPFSWVTGSSQVSRVLAQINVGGCAPDASRIIQDLGGTCDANWASTADVQRFESEMASNWLKAHQLEETDISMIYQYGRIDLRSELRGYMLLQLLQIIGKPSTERTDDHEIALYTGFQKKVQQHEIELYTAALNEYNRWYLDPCHWTPDPDLAKQYNLSYDGTAYCVTGQAPQNYAPNYDYFIAYGLKNSYGKAVSDHKNGPLVQSYTGISLGLAVGAIALPTSLISGLIVTALVIKNLKDIFPFAVRVGQIFSTAFEGGEAGVLAVLVIIAVMTLIVGTIEVFSSDANAKNIAKLSSQLASAKANSPDLASFLPDKTGMYKLTATFTGLTLPDFPSTLPLPAHQDTDLDLLVTEGGQPVDHMGGAINYLDWFGTSWSAKTYGGWLVQTGITKTGQAVDSITPTILYTDWSGNQYSASRTGNNFLITKALPASTDTECKADETTGVTAIILPTCSSYVSPSFQLMDHDVRVDGPITEIQNGPQFTISLKNPAFTSPAQATFVVGTASKFQITAKGIPTPDILGWGQLPNGISWTSGNPVTLSGTPTAGTEGVYPLTLKARNTAAIVTQNFTLNVVPGLAFTSSSNAVFTGGQPGSFTITTTGKPTPSLAIGMPLPAGLSFKDNGDGTATISGTPAAPTRNPPTAILCAYPGCGVQATNAVGSVFQALTITVNPTPLTIATSPPGLQFTISSADGQTCPASGTYTPPKTLGFYLEDKCVIAFASPISGGTGTQYVFQNWGFVASNPRIVTAPPLSTTYTAFFAPQYYLTTSAGPGGAISPASGWVGGLNFTSWSTSVAVTATPSAGYAFTGFTGNLSGATNPQSISLTAPQSVTANFGLITATATSNPPVARVTSAGGTGSFELTASFQLPPALQGVDISTAVPVTATLNPLVGTTTTP